MSQSILVYFEKQGTDSSLCAMHALNALLQGPRFSEFDLSKIARELDEKESQIMSESGRDSRDFLEYIVKDSENVGLDGNFNIQVITHACSKLGLHCFPLKNQIFDSKFDLDKEQAFLCHMDSHFFILRRIKGEWYNLNSLLPKPERMTDFYLRAYLESIVKDPKCSIYAIQGNLEQVSTQKSSKSSTTGQWIRMKGDDETDLREAIEASLIENKPTKQETDSLLDEALKLSLQESQKNSLVDSIPKTQSLFDVHLYMLQNMSKCTEMMEKLEKRLTSVEDTTNFILESQKFSK